MNYLLFLKKLGTGLNFQNQLTNPKFVENCGPETIFPELYIIWIFDFYYANIYFENLKRLNYKPYSDQEINHL